MANVYLTGFNNQFSEFIDDIKLCFPDSKDVLIAHSMLTKARKANPKLLIKIWNSKINTKNKKEIEENNLEFFFNHDYNEDLSNDDILNGIDKIRTRVRELSDENKDKIKLYLKNLSKLADLYFIN